MLTSYHVHSTLSDGISSLEELAEGAVRLGLDELGISDHYVFIGGGRQICWSMPLSDLDKYVQEIARIRDTFAGKVTVRIGLEADYDPDTIDELRERLAPYPFDYVIGSIHYIDSFPVDEHKHYWDELSEDERSEMMREYWVRIADLARSGVFDFVGHLDLYKKFGHQPTTDLSEEITVALDAIAESGMALEMNTSGWNMEHIREAYPSQLLLQSCRKRAIPIVINADAHQADALTLNFDRARALARACGYTEVAVFAKRSMSLVPLE